LTGLSQAEVAEAAGVSIPTLKRAEAGGPIKVAEDIIGAIAKALEKVGVEFDRSKPRGARPRAAHSLNSSQQWRQPCGRRTALDDNVFDLVSFLHPGTAFEHPGDVVSHAGLTLAESAPSWPPGPRMHQRSHRVRRCGLPKG
jgi:hypothetical protein